MKITIGSRGSPLALAQVKLFCDAAHAIDASLTFDVVTIKTSGDKKQGTEAARFGDKKDWIYELEEKLLDGSIDIALHSGKDVPGNIEGGTTIYPVCERELACDIFIGNRKADGSVNSLHELSGTGGKGRMVGTASLRRKAALLHKFPELEIIEWRGNIQTRIDKLYADPKIFGIVIAAAGVMRLGIAQNLSYEKIPFEVMLPSLNQGLLIAQTKEDASVELRHLLERLSTPGLTGIFKAERACAQVLEGDCNSAISIYASADGSNAGGELNLECRVYSQDGKSLFQEKRSGGIEKASEIGRSVAESLIEKGAKAVL